MTSDPLRIGLLGASRIALESVITPARDGSARLVVVGARDLDRAAGFAADHGIERAVVGYPQVIEDPEVEVVYNALPNSLHAPWNLAAIAAGKHVLTEKPFASNADEARVVAAAAADAGVIVFDAFHYRYHPIFDRLLELITTGALGTLRELRVRMRMPAPAADDLRWSFALAGGAMMDLGCYALHAIDAVSAALGGSPALVRAEADERHGHPGVDERFRAEFALPGGAVATAHCDMAHPDWEFSITAAGEAATATIMNFVKVSQDDRLVVRTGTGGERVERFGPRTSYHFQLDALTAAVRTGGPVRTDAADGVRNLELIDACYRSAGLTPRPSALLTPAEGSDVEP